MSVEQAAISVPVSKAESINPPSLNGDVALTSDERRAYLKFHRVRNRHNRHQSRVEGVFTRPFPCRAGAGGSLSSPSRVALDAFVVWAGRGFADTFGSRTIRVLDLGCGSGYVRTLLERAGLGGEYVGIDHRAHPGFAALQCASFAHQMIIDDGDALAVENVGSADLPISMTAFEHFEDEAAAPQRVCCTLRPVSPGLDRSRGHHPASLDAAVVWAKGEQA